MEDNAAVGVGMEDKGIGQPPDFRQSLRVLGVGAFPRFSELSFGPFP